VHLQVAIKFFYEQNLNKIYGIMKKTKRKLHFKRCRKNIIAINLNTWVRMGRSLLNINTM